MSHVYIYIYICIHIYAYIYSWRKCTVLVYLGCNFCQKYLNPKAFHLEHNYCEQQYKCQTDSQCLSVQVCVCVNV